MRERERERERERKSSILPFSPKVGGIFFGVGGGISVGYIEAKAAGKKDLLLRCLQPVRTSSNGESDFPKIFRVLLRCFQNAVEAHF